MVLLTRSPRPQPASSISSSSFSVSTSFKGSKLAVPRPVNLPSLRREHAGNDPTISLVGGTGSSGWSKQQVSALSVDDGDGLPIVETTSVGMRSVALAAESTWGTSVSQARVVPVLDGVDQSVDGKLTPYQATTARAAVYTPPGARNARTNGIPISSYLPASAVEKVVVLRGEDFPTLQAAVPSLAAPPQQRQRDLQQRQREKQHELKDQQKKLHQLSQQQHSHKPGEDVSPTERRSGPQLQPAQPMRPQVRSKQSSNGEVRSLDAHETFMEQGNSRSGKAGRTPSGPSPLIRLSHTSNWADDERETLQNLSTEGIATSKWVEPGRPRNGYRGTDDWVEHHGVDVGHGRPRSRSGAESGSGRDGEDLKGTFPVRNGSLGSEGKYGKDADFSKISSKAIQGDKLVLDLRDDVGKSDGGLGRSDSLRQRWVSPVKDSNRFGISRISSFNRDTFVHRDNGFEKDMNGRIFRDAGNVRDTPYRGDVLSRDMTGRDGYSRDAGLGRDSNFGKDNFLSKRGDVGSNLHGSRGWQGDRIGRSNSSKFDGRTAYSQSNSHVRARGRLDLNGLDYGRDRRPNMSAHVEDPFLGEIMDARANPVFGLEPLVGVFGLDIRAIRKKKDIAKNSDFRDLARESFEAELERVQKMQEQERQRIIEEQEKAIELARKEQEEQERLAREEEELRLKLEEEAREAVARAKREAEEAARKVEEMRRAREEEKQRMSLEEEKRREAARRKLLELEERIAKREAEKKREGVLQREEKVCFTRPPKEQEAVGFQVVEGMDWEDQDRCTTSFGKVVEDDDERAPFRAHQPLQSPRAGKQLVEGPPYMANFLDSGLQPADMHGGLATLKERSKSLQTWRREAIDNGLPFAPMKSSLRDDLLPPRQREQQQRVSAVTESNHGSSPRSLSSPYARERMQTEYPGRNRRASFVEEQQWTPSDDTEASGRYPSDDIDAGYGNTVNERNADWWGRNNYAMSREGQRVQSPPLPSYLQGTEARDYPSFGRLRQSLPKQPRVPPPPGRGTLPRQAFRPDGTQSVPSSVADDDRRPALKGSESLNKIACPEDEKSEKVDKVKELSSNMQLSEQCEAAVYEEISMQPGVYSQVSEELFEDASPRHTQTVHEDCSEEVVSEQFSSEVVNPVMSKVEGLERLESEIVHVPCVVTEDEGEDWVGQGGEVGTDDSAQVLNERSREEVEDEIFEPSEGINDEVDGREHATKYSAEITEANIEGRAQDDGPKDDKQELDNPPNPQLQDSESIQMVAEEISTDPASLKVLHETIVHSEPQVSSFLPVSAMESVQMRQPEGLSSRQSLVQQFQQPFSFMAVPLPQSTTPTTVTPHPSMLASVHALQNQQEMPFHLQLGVLPGTPLMPNAIQVGSIQMPLPMHPPLPQLAHLHGPQPPMFQFWQIGHSAPLSQALPIVQPGVQIHHAMRQPLVAQHDQLQDEALNQSDSSNKLLETEELLKAEELPLGQNVRDTHTDHDPSLDGSGQSEHATSKSFLSSDFNCEQKDQTHLVGQYGKTSGVPASVSKKQNSTLPFAAVQAGCESVTEKFIFPTNVMVVENLQADQSSAPQSSGMTPGERKRNDAPRSHVTLGRGRGRFRGGKNNGFEFPRSGTEMFRLDMAAGGGMQNRMIRRNFRRAEYKARDLLSSLDRESAVVNEGKHQSTPETSQALGFEVSRDAVSELGTHIYSRTLNGDMQNVGGITGSHPLQGGVKVERSNMPKGHFRNGFTDGSASKGILKKYKPGNIGDAPLQSGVVCVFEQPGIETPNDEDDFIEVRSKRQMHREQREQREKEIKAKSKDLKAKEQATRKQQRLSSKVGQHTDVAGTISSKHAAERRPAPSSEAAGNGLGFTTQGLTATTLPKSMTNVTTAQVLPPIGTRASILSDATQEKKSKALKSGQADPHLGATFNQSGDPAGSAHDSHASAQDSLANTVIAWGGQRSTQEVVSLTQIQLEEAMKPIRFEGPLAQKLPMSERVSMVFEPGMSVPSTVVHEKAPTPVKASVSVSGPISSLLAGETIQFGAVTSPTLISSSSHPLSPALLVGAGSSSESRSDMSHTTAHSQSNVRHLPASNGDAFFTSKGKRAREDDDIHGQAVDPEAEAEAAASAVAVAAISIDDSVGNARHSESRSAVVGGGAITVAGSSFDNLDVITGSSGVATTRPSITQTPIKPPSIEDSMAMALPADLSVEMPLPLLQGSSSSGQASSGSMLQPLPGGASHFPCLEMGTMLGGPIFAFGPCEDASALSQGSRSGASLDPGLAAMGGSSVGGWHQRHSGTADSFYGAPPSGYTGPFMGPAGGIPSIQGPPHMLVYTNPFAPVGQFGQLGVSFMGTTYLPSGKQPDWKHTPMTGSSSGGLVINDGDMHTGLPGMLAPQRGTGASNSVPQMSPSGSSMMPVAAPLSFFDANLSAPFQISNADVPVQSHWSNVPVRPLHSLPLPGPTVGLSQQPRLSSALPSPLGHLPHLLDVNNSFHQLPVSKPIVSSSFSSVDAAAQFPDELGLGDSASSNNSLGSSVQQSSSSRVHVSNSAVSGATGTAGIKLQRGRRPSRNPRVGSSGMTGGNNGDLSVMNMQIPNGNRSGSSLLHTQNLGQPGSLGHHPHSLVFADQVASQQSLARASLGTEWSGGSNRKGAPGRTIHTERGSIGERGSSLSTKLKQVYVAKPPASTRKLGAATADPSSSMFSVQEVARAAMGC